MEEGVSRGSNLFILGLALIMLSANPYSNTSPYSKFKYIVQLGKLIKVIQNT